MLQNHVALLFDIDLAFSAEHHDQLAAQHRAVFDGHPDHDAFLVSALITQMALKECRRLPLFFIPQLPVSHSLVLVIERGPCPAGPSWLKISDLTPSDYVLASSIAAVPHCFNEDPAVQKQVPLWPSPKVSFGVDDAHTFSSLFPLGGPDIFTNQARQIDIDAMNFGEIGRPFIDGGASNCTPPVCFCHCCCCCCCCCCCRCCCVVVQRGCRTRPSGAQCAAP